MPGVAPSPAACAEAGGASMNGQRFPLALRLADIGCWEWSAASGRFAWSSEYGRLLDLPPEAPQSREVWLGAILPEDQARVRDLLQACMERRLQEIAFEYRVLLPAGEVRWLSARARLLRSRSERRAVLYGLSRDVTASIDAERRQHQLVAELQHRAKNMFAMVRSLAARSAQSSATVEDFKTHLDGRLDALARTHVALSREPDGSVELEDIVRDELLSQGVQEGEQLGIDGPPVRLRHRTAEMLALALHELATNAVKFGAIAAPDGHLAITWSVTAGADGPVLELRWSESGAATLAATPRRAGFGRELIERALPYEFGARTALHFTRGGASCSIDLPLHVQAAATWRLSGPEAPAGIG